MPNEIELLVSVRRSGDSGIKKRGDVLTCMPAGGKWGKKDLAVHQLVTWPSSSPTEDELKAFQLMTLIFNKKKQTESNPRIDFPFCEIVDELVEDDEGNPVEYIPGKQLIRTAMTNRSVLHFDFSSLSEEKINYIFDESVAAETISADELTVLIDEVGIDKRPPSERGLKEHREIQTANPILHADTAKRRDQSTDIQEFLGD